MDLTRADKLREEGNEYFNNENYRTAIEKYDEALQYSRYDYRILSNKAKALERMGNYTKAEEAACLSYRLSKNNIKGFYRAAEAACKLQRYKEALKYLLVGLHFNKDDKDLTDYMRKVTAEHFPDKVPEEVRIDVMREVSRVQVDRPAHEFNGSLDGEDEGRDTRTPEKSGLSTPKKKQGKKEPPKPNSKKEVLKVVNKHASEGSRYYFDGAAKPAADKFLLALSSIGDNDDLMVVGMDLLVVDVVRYAYAIACIETTESLYISYGIKTLEEMTADVDKRFPFVYLTIGKGYVNLNLFKMALEPLLKGLNIIKKRLQKYCPWYWPGYPKKPIAETTATANLKDKLTNFLELCKNPPTPEGVCRYSYCDFPYPFTDSKRDIYFTDPDFKGYYDIGCSEKCRIQYHLSCWKNLKTTNDKKTDKDMYGMKCVTPDCDGVISEVMLVDADGSEVVIGHPVIEEPLGKQKRTSKLEKKAEQKMKRKMRRDDRDSAFPTPKEITDDSKSNPEEPDFEAKDIKTDIVRRNKKERKTTMETEEEEKGRGAAEAAKRPKAVPLPIDIADSEIKVLKKNEEEHSVKVKKPKEPKKKKADKNYIIIDDVMCPPDELNVVEDSFERSMKSCALAQEACYGSSPFARVPQDQVSSWMDGENASLVDSSAAIALMTFFMDFVKSNGPTDTDSGMLLDIVQQLPTSSQEIVANVGGLKSFLLTNRQFASVDEVICCLGDLSKLAESLISSQRVRLNVSISRPVGRLPSESQDYPSLEEVNPIEDKWESEEESDDDDEDDDEDYCGDFSVRSDSPIDDNTVSAMMMAVADECEHSEEQVSIREEYSRVTRRAEAQVQTDMSAPDIQSREDLIQSLCAKLLEQEQVIRRHMDTKTKFQNKTAAEVTELKKKLEESDARIKQSESSKKEVVSNWEAEKKKLATERKKGLDEVKKAAEDKKKAIREKEAAEAEAEKQNNQREKAEQNLLAMTLQIDQLSDQASDSDKEIKALQAALKQKNETMQAFQVSHLEQIANVFEHQVERVQKECRDNLNCLAKAEILANSGSTPSSSDIKEATQQWMDVLGDVLQVQRSFKAQVETKKDGVRNGTNLDMDDITFPNFSINAPTLINPKFPVENQIQMHPASTALSQLLKRLPQQQAMNGFPNFVVPPPLPNPALATFLTPHPSLSAPSTSTPSGLMDLVSPPTEKPREESNTSSITETSSKVPIFDPPPSTFNTNFTKPAEKHTEQNDEPLGATAATESDKSSSRSSTPSFGGRHSQYPMTNTADDAKIFVGKIPLHYKEKDLKALFSKYVSVADVSLRLSGYSNNFAFITLQSIQERDFLLSCKPIYLEGNLLNIEAKLPKDQQMPASYMDKAGIGGPRLRFEHKREEAQEAQDKAFFVHPASKVLPKQPQAATMPHRSSPVETAAMDAIKSQELLSNMLRRIPSCSRQELLNYLVQIRDSRPSHTLNGLPEEQIYLEVQRLMQKKKKGGSIVGGVGGLDDFAAPPTAAAWGGKGTRTEETNFKDVEDECAICYEKIHRKVETPLSCGHTFHRKCVERWVREQSTCPKCRKHVLLPDEFPSLQ